jgi:hypothetical protein
MTGSNLTDRSRSGTKRHVLTDQNGIPLLSVTITAANTHDMKEAALQTLDRTVLERPLKNQNLCLSRNRKRISTKRSVATTTGGYTILTGATISIFVYVHILMQNRRGNKKTSTTATTTAAAASSLLMPSSTSTSLRKNSKNTIINNNSIKSNQKRKIPKRFIPWLLFVSLTITVALMVYASHGLF